MIEMKVGDYVAFAHPKNAREELEAMEVLELRGDRVLVGELTYWYTGIQPTFVYPASELVVAIR